MIRFLFVLCTFSVRVKILAQDFKIFFYPLNITLKNELSYFPSLIAFMSIQTI